MESDSIQYLKEQRALHEARLRELEKRQSRYGYDTPPHITTEIEDIKHKITAINQNISDYYDSINEYIPEENEYTQKEDNPLTPKVMIYTTGIIVISCGILIFFVVLFNPSVLNEEFSTSHGLESWRSNGSTKIIGTDDKDAYTSNKAVIQLSGLNSYTFRILVDSVEYSQKYTATTWCKAPIGSRCRIYLGTVQEGTSLPLADSSKTITRDGTGEWESLSVTTTIERGSQLAIFLYSENTDQPVLFDDISVVK